MVSERAVEAVLCTVLCSLYSHHNVLPTVQRGLSLSMVCTAGHSTYLLFISFSCRTTHCELQVNVHFLKTSSLQVIEIRE